MKFDKFNLMTHPDSSNNDSEDKQTNHYDSARSSVNASEKWLVRKFLSIVGNPAIYIRLPDGSKITTHSQMPAIGMHLIDRGILWKFLTNPGLYFGEGFSAERIIVEGDLVEFLNTIIKTRPHLHSKNYLSQFLLQGFSKNNRNDVSTSQDNIYHHYDVGNDFYKLWLDKEMVYTCAYYPILEASLEQAQFAKLDYVCRKLRLKPGETVFEAGCGWGSLARHMAKYYGVKVKAYNVSPSQIEEARSRAKAEGLDSLVEFFEDDYRNISGKCDAFVSIGMLEHVGTSNYETLGAVINKSLTHNGRGLIHTIGQNEAMPMNPWLMKHIFPGGYTPTLGEMMQVFEPYAFTITDVESLRLHYARTLTDWLYRFDQHEDRIRDMFDESFVRTWRLYLAGSIANFTSGTLNLFQVMFTRSAMNDIPLTRAYLYNDNENTYEDSKAWNLVKS
jgi:cyclopropane-fatty-acyl-phospholipid synthase